MQRDGGGLWRRGAAEHHADGAAVPDRADGAAHQPALLQRLLRRTQHRLRLSHPAPLTPLPQHKVDIQRHLSSQFKSDILSMEIIIFLI